MQSNNGMVSLGTWFILKCSQINDAQNRFFLLVVSESAKIILAVVLVVRPAHCKIVRHTITGMQISSHCLSDYALDR